jgi:nuclear GTP-binding protein
MGNGGKWKAKSKRVSTKLRVKIEKKVNEHKKKIKKEMKKNPGKFHKSKKDPGVPNNCPFKDEVGEIPF